MKNKQKLLCEIISENILRYKTKDYDIILEDLGDCKGKIIISSSYEHNYSCFWGSMGTSIRDFICSINEFYFADKLLGSRRSNEMDCKKTFTAIRKYIKNEMYLPWYKHQEFQKDLREHLNSFEKACEDVSGDYAQNYFVDNFFRSFVDRVDYYLIEDEKIEDVIKTATEMGFKSGVDAAKDELTELVKNQLIEAIQDGIILGMKESLKILNQYLEIKTQKGYPMHIDKGELNLFLETYIQEQENLNQKSKNN